MTRLCLALVGFALAPFSIGTVRAQARSGERVVAGHVVSAFGTPIAGAEVALLPGDLHVTTDSTGRFRLIAPSGPQKLVVRRIGFAPRAFDLAPEAERGYQLEV
ncbi:MAG: carboxypeptidase-like regulatory domain-containing protein, partial [Gemmatimonadota bacterium]